MSVRDREDAVVAALRDLAPHLDGEPDPAFRAATRARLVAMAAVRSPEPEPARGMTRFLRARAEATTRPPWRTRLTAGLAGAALTVTAAASLVALSDGARPGDVLYGLKRGTEQTQLALAGDARGQTLLDFASTRLTELRELVDEPNALAADGGSSAGGTVLAAGADPKLVISTLETMDDQTTEGTAWLTDHAVSGRSEAPLDDLAVWAASQTAGLTALAPGLPSAAGAAVARSMQLLTDVTARTQGLQTALTCSSGPAVGAADALGPVPAPCVPSAPGDPAQQTVAGLPGTGSAAVPGSTAAPTVPPAGTTTGGSATTGGAGTLPGGIPVPGTTLPTNPSLPVPTLSVPLPLPTTGTLLNLPSPDLPLNACLPPLATIGDC